MGKLTRVTAVIPLKPDTIYRQKQQLRDALDRTVLETLRYITPGMILFFLVLALVHLLVLPPAAARVAATLAFVTAVVSLSLYILQRRAAVPASWSHTVGAVLLFLTLINSLVTLYLLGEPRQTTNVLFVVLAAGLVFLSIRWFAALLALTIVGWSLVVALLPPLQEWLHYGLALIVSSLLAAVVLFMRLRTLEGYERLRFHNEQRTQELNHAARQLQTITAVGHRITSILDLDVLLNQVVAIIQEMYGYYFVGVFLLEESDARLRLCAGTGTAGQLLCAQGFSMSVGAEGLVGWVAENGRFINVPDVFFDKRYHRHDLLPDTRSELDLPLTRGDMLSGVLSLQSERLAAFAPEDIAFLQLLADQVAIAIHNASVYQREQEARRLAETLQKTGHVLSSTLNWSEVLARILVELAHIVAYDRASILVPQEQELIMVAGQGFPEGIPQIRVLIGQERDSIYRQIYETKRPLPIPDVQLHPDWQQVDTLPITRSWLGVPLLHGVEVVGMLSLARETYQPYANDEIRLAATFAGQAAIALRNARIYERLSEFNRQLEFEVHKRTVAIQEAYDQLEQMDRTKSDFIRIAAHELRTPLTLMRGYSQMLLKDSLIVESTFHQEMVSGIFSGANRLHEIINSMVDMAKIDSRSLHLYPEPISIPALLTEVLTPLQPALRERKLTLRLDAMREMPGIVADPDALQKVFYHLIINAIKYTPDGGTITITGTPMTSNGANQPPVGVEIVVSDTGIGIPPDLLELIFIKFYQTGQVALHSTGKTKFKGGGPGLGLAIAQGIVEAHGGRIWAKSSGYDEEACPGSQFHVFLPLTQA